MQHQFTTGNAVLLDEEKQFVDIGKQTVNKYQVLFSVVYFMVQTVIP